MTRPSYPPARRESLTEEIAGRCVADPYRWLEDFSSTQTRAWSAAQDVLFRMHRERWPQRAYFHEQLGELLATSSEAAPVWRGQRRFLVRVPEEDPMVVVVEPDGPERVLIDPRAIDPSGGTVLVAWRPSRDGGLVAYQLSRRGSEESALWVVEVEDGRVVDGPFARTRRSPVAWVGGSHAFYYVRQPDPENPGDCGGVMLHRVGHDPDGDIQVFGEDYERGSRFGVKVSADGRWMTVSMTPGTAPRNALLLADLTSSDLEKPDLRTVHDGDAAASVKFGGDGRIYVLTDLDAPNGRICTVDPAAPTAWETLVPEEREAVLDDCVVLDGRGVPAPALLVTWTRHAISELTLHDLTSGAKIGEVPLPGLGSVRQLTQREGRAAWFTYTDFTSRPARYRFDARDGRLEHAEEAPGEDRASGVHTRQMTYPAKDGTALRMFVMAGQPSPAAPRPAILFVYGGFGASCLPAYSPTALAWVQAGGLYAVASVRGGGEEGAAWHRVARGEHKQVTVDDVHDTVEWLVAQGWTTHEQLVLSGGSHGGLVVGAVLTQRPDSCAAVVCSNPVLDMVRYERFGLGHLWVEEFGSASDPEQLGWLLSYSPYHHVRAGVEYPAVLFTCPDVDPRVDAMHVRKMAAALQHATASDRPVLVRREFGTGHTVGSASNARDLWSDVLAFAAAATGLTPESGE